MTALFFFESRLRYGWRVVILLGLWIGLSTAMYFIFGIVNLLFAYLLLVAVSWFVLKFIDDRPLTSIGLALDKKALRYSIVGSGIGAGMLLAVWGMMLAGGVAHVETASIDGIALLSIAGIFFANAFGEELLFRGYIFQHLVEATGPVTSVVSCSVLFAAVHLGNPGANVLGIVNVVLAGVWLSLGFLVWRSLWAVTAMHWAWNFVQGSVVGLPVSGGNFPSILQSPIEVGVPDIVSGGAFGAEGNIFTTIMLVISIGFFYRKWKNA